MWTDRIPITPTENYFEVAQRMSIASIDKAVNDIIIDTMITNSTKAGDSLGFVDSRLISLWACAMLIILSVDDTQLGSSFLGRKGRWSSMHILNSSVFIPEQNV